MAALPLSRWLKPFPWSFRRPARKPLRHREQLRPRLEALEERSLPAVFPVTTLADAGTGTLRQAILDANATAGDDTIPVQVTGTINLAGALPDLTTNIAIQGPGAASLTVRRDTGGDYRIFTVVAGVTASISGLTVSNGSGGGVLNSGTLTVSTSTVSGNSGGPGISNTGTLTVSNTTISGNTTGNNGDGGGIWNTSTLTVSNSTISVNSAHSNGGGIANIGTLTVSNTTIARNIAISFSGGGGGGIFNNSGTVTIYNSVVSRNTAAGSSAGGGTGGGIFNNGRGTVEVNSSTISENTAIRGGGGILNLNDGGGIARTTVSNSTISDNYAGGSGGGIDNGGTLTVANSTIVGNSATNQGGGIHVRMPMVAQNTIIAGNTAPAGPDGFGNLGSQGHNLIRNTSGSSGHVPTDLLGVDPRLGPLRDNGGPTWTHALLPGSPALDAGDNTGAPGTDQRGLPRVVAGTIDIGSFEVQVGPVASFFLWPFVATVPVDVPVDLYVVALDAYGHLVTDYAGTVYLVSTNPAVPPVAFTFRPEDGGVAYWEDAVTFRTPGPQLLLAIDATFTAIGLGLFEVT